MTFICYPRCSTCKKAEKWLKDHNKEYELRDIKENNPTYDELSFWYKESALPLKKFFNTSGMKYRELDLKNRIPGMSDEEQLELLSSDGLLVKRPLLIGDGFILIGFKEKEWAEKLGE